MSEKRGGRRAARHAAAAAAAACPNANRSAATGSSAKPRHPTSQFAEGKAPGLGAATHGSGNWGEGLARTKRVVGGEQVAEGVAGHQRGTRGLIQRAGSRHRPEGVFAGLAEPRAPQGPGHPSTHHQEAISSAGSCRMGGWRAKRAGDAAVALVLRPQGRVLLKKGPRGAGGGRGARPRRGTRARNDQLNGKGQKVCVCVTGIGHINVLGPNPLTLPAVQSEENLAADGIPGRLRLASAMPVCRAAVRRPDAATKVP